jgi:hypothetical protein
MLEGSGWIDCSTIIYLGSMSITRLLCKPLLIEQTASKQDFQNSQVPEHGAACYAGAALSAAAGKAFAALQDMAPHNQSNPSAAEWLQVGG